MKIIRTINEMNIYKKDNSKKNIGLVPTMGFLHEGHLSLVDEAKKENDIVVMSIFVNPLQFGPNEDYDAYPRNEEKDIATAKSRGIDILFIPSVKEMYPKQLGIKLLVEQGTNVLCGRSRAGHFDGVGIVLTKLFHIIQPTKAYFGLKDAQQFAVVHLLVEQLNFPLQVVGLPTVREIDGLAKSSRNVNLSVKERQEAIILYKSLQYARDLIVDGTKNPVIIKNEVKKIVENETSGKIDYIEVLNYPELDSIEMVNEQVIIAVAVQFDHARLIDNIILSQDGKIVERL